MARTLAAMTAGSFVQKLVVAIEGCKYLLSDAPEDAVLDAWSGSDWGDVIEGLYIDLQSEQRADPWNPFATGGRCTLRVIDTDRSDTFGKFVNRRSGGGETALMATCDRDDVSLTVASTAGFPATGDAFIGTECFEYDSSGDATHFGVVKRGKYSPFASGGSDTRFPNHHRVGKDSNHVAHFPTVSQLPRVWIGKRVGVYLHTWNEASEELNSNTDAQLVFAGRIASLREDENTFETVIELSPIQDELKDASCGRDMFSATLAGGLYLQAGRVFKFTDWRAAAPSTFNAVTLTVVDSGATGTDEVNAGWYDGDQICDFLSRWLGAAKAATDIVGYYTWAFGVTSNVGLRTKAYWSIDNGEWWFNLPGEVAAFLGILNAEGDPRGQSHQIHVAGRQDDEEGIYQGDSAPYSLLIFAPNGPGFAQEFAEAIVYDLVDDRGTFVDQTSLMPGVIKTALDDDHEWGIFLFADKVLVVAAYDDTTGQLSNVWLSPYQLTAYNPNEAITYIGVRLDESNDGPPGVKQVYLLEGTLSTLLKTLVYSTGTSAFNHADFDSLGFGIGIGIPGALLQGEFEHSLNNLPGAAQPLVIVIDEPTKFSDLIGADLLLRRAFLRWKDEGLEFATWRTPMLADSIADLDETNKAAPSGNDENHRSPSLEDATFVRPAVKIDYAKDFAVGKDGQYLRNFTLEDQTATDDGGNTAKPYTLKMRNTYSQWANTGAGVESLIPNYLATMPLFSRAGRSIRRSIDMRYWEQLAPGDVVGLTDEFARDPVTGARSITDRPAMVTRISWNPGGGSSNGSSRDMTGEVELMCLDLHRGSAYAPCADVDYDDSSDPGDGHVFDHGYDHALMTLRTVYHAYSEDIELINQRRFGTISIPFPGDGSYFAVGDEILIVERDPDDPATPLSWERTIASVTLTLDKYNIELDSALSSPAFDNTKRYRIVPNKWSVVQTSQQETAFQADSADLFIEDDEYPFHYVASSEPYGFYETDSTAELLPDVSAGDGRPYDVGHDAALIRTLNAFHDRKSAHQAPCLNTDSEEDVTADGVWAAQFAGPMHFGTEHLPGTIEKLLVVAPYFWSHDGNPGSVRVTLSRMIPTLAPSAEEDSGNAFFDSRFGQHSSQQEWTTTDTTPTVVDAKNLTIAVKDLFFGMAWLVVETTGSGTTNGLAECYEGPRVAVWQVALEE